MSSSPHYSSYPIPLSGKTKTTVLVDTGFARNGIHEANMTRLDVWMEISRLEMQCRKCHSIIEQGEVYGASTLKGNYCRDCIAIPSWAKHLEVTVFLKRGRGQKVFNVVTSLNAIDQFARRARREGYRCSIVEKKLFDNSYGAESRRINSRINMDTITPIPF